jgi:hypothetical protein
MSKTFSTVMQTKSAQWGMLLFGLTSGAIFPDLDLRVPFLLHRSIVTHGMLLPIILLCIWVRFRPQLQWVRTLSVGFCAALAAHLSLDLFPWMWKGFALIHIPGYGRSSAEFSWGWITGSIVVCAYLAASSMRSAPEIIATVIGVSIVIGIAGEPWLRPAIVLIVAILLAEGIEQGQEGILERMRQHRTVHERTETKTDS